MSSTSHEIGDVDSGLNTLELGVAPLEVEEGLPVGVLLVKLEEVLRLLCLTFTTLTRFALFLF